MAGFGFTMNSMLGMIIFMALAFGSYWVTLPSVIKLDKVDDLPFVRELIHYIFFMVAVIIIIPFIMGKMSDLKIFKKGDMPAVAGGSSGGEDLLSAFGRRR
jgi:hypothetical protein